MGDPKAPPRAWLEPHGEEVGAEQSADLRGHLLGTIKSCARRAGFKDRRRQVFGEGAV